MLDEGKREQVVEYCWRFRGAKQRRQVIGTLIPCTNIFAGPLQRQAAITAAQRYGGCQCIALRMDIPSSVWQKPGVNTPAPNSDGCLKRMV